MSPILHGGWHIHARTQPRAHQTQLQHAGVADGGLEHRVEPPCCERIADGEGQDELGVVEVEGDDDVVNNGAQPAAADD